MTFKLIFLGCCLLAAHALTTHGQPYARGPLLVLLEPSMQPASADECARWRPDLGRPYFTASKNDRSGEPYHHRTCWFDLKGST